MRILLLIILFITGAFAGEIKLTDQNATDPVYILPLKKYPNWLAEAELKNGKKVQFVSVKSMMQVYQHQDYFLRHKLIDDNISKIYVQDYISGRRIEAPKAVYLFGSRIIGPHGDDLIPFENEENAKLFMMKNGGTKILPFSKLSKGLIRYLDM
jgi:nitrous oxide reductase accessory protein NosL